MTQTLTSAPPSAREIALGWGGAGTTFGNVRSGSAPAGAPGLAAPGWEPSAGTLTLPFELTADVAEVLVHGQRDGRYLAGAIELVSERNKDRPEAREAFVAKCATYLHSGVGLIIFDAVTTRTANRGL